MSTQDENNMSLSKKGQREVSPFIGHELLYDYVTGTLDSERQAAVADHVKFSRDAQLDLEKIQNGQAYALKLSQTVVSQTIIEKINTPSNYVTVLLQKTQFDKWPQGLKWGLEALLVVAAMVLVLTIAPWQKVFEWGQGLNSDDVVLSEVHNPTAAPATEDRPDFVDEELNAPVAEVKPVVAATLEVKKPTAEKPEVLVAADKPAPTPQKTPVAAVAVTASPTPTASTGGFLYRGEFEVTNLDMTGPKISELISSLGGRKAGSVELGWKKTPTSAYYHFTIPEGQYQELLNQLQPYGSVNLVKEKHSRVMPDGIVRVIITVDEGTAP